MKKINPCFTSVTMKKITAPFILGDNQSSFLMACSLLLAGFTQLHWVIRHHAPIDLWYRLPLATLLVLIAFKSVIRLHRSLFAAKIPASNVNAFLILVVLTPTVRLISSQLTQSFFLSLITLTAVALLTPFPIKNIHKRILLFLGYAGASGLLFIQTPVPVGCLSIELQNIPSNNKFFIFNANTNGVDYTTFSRQHVSPATFSKLIHFNITGTPSKLGIRFGGHPDTVTISNISLAANFLWWHLPVRVLTEQEMGASLTTLDPQVSAITSTKNGFRISPLTPIHPAWMIVALPDLNEEIGNQHAVYQVKLIAWLTGLVSCLLLFKMLSINVTALLLLFWKKIHTIDLFPCIQDQPLLRKGSISNNKHILFYSAVTLLILVWGRSWYNLSFPAFYVEDAVNHFSQFFGDSSHFHKIFLQPNGYPALVTYGYAWLVGSFSAVIQPWLYLAFAMLVATITLMSLSVSGLIKNKPILFIAPLLLGLTGLNHFFYWSTVTYQIFTLILLLLTLLLYPPPLTNKRYILRLLLITLCVWAGPYSVLAVPVCLLLWAVGYYRANRGIYLWTIFNSLLYYSQVTAEAVSLQEALVDPQRYKELFTALFQKVYLLDLVPLNPASLLCWLISCVVILIILRHNKRYLILTSALFFITFLNLVIYFVSSKYRPGCLQPNHLLISYYFYLVWLLLSLDRLYNKIHCKLPVAGAAFIFITLFMVTDNYEHPEKRKTARMNELPTFLSTVDDVTTQRVPQLKENNQRVTLVSKSSWGEFIRGPHINLGSKASNARQLGPDDFPESSDKQFIAK